MSGQNQHETPDSYEARLAGLERRLLAIEAGRRGVRVSRPALPGKRNITGQIERFGLIGAWIIVVVVLGAAVPQAFLSWLNFSTIFSSQAVLVVLTLGLLIPLTAGDFDLSVSSTLTLSAMTLTLLNAQHGWGVVPSVAVALSCGVLIGFLNGVIVLFFRIHSLIVTLGVGTFINGIILWISGSQTISGVSFNLVNWVIVTRLFGISLTFYYALLLCVLIWYCFEYTTIGRRLLFVGRGREVARLSGIRVDRVRLASFVIGSTIAAGAGVLYAGMTGSADPISGLNLLLPAFAAAFLGATSIVPGRFNPWGSLIGVYFLVTGITGLTMLGVDTLVQNLFYGGGLVVAVSLSQLVRKRQPQNFS
jgi:ribose transport system permease protein